ncbi:MAG: signal recognition particle protein, partial [Ruthenibacterium sp.]
AQEASDKEFVLMKAIIQSMTSEERAKPAIVNPKRKRRIAAGSGTRVEDVNRLLRQFEQMNKMMRQFKKNPKMFGKRGGMGGMMR